jgi:ABC-type Fe3+-siderophore transport system permease subunit
MATTLTRPAVDVGPPQARPGLALVLGLLSLPGSTIAWELPLGGLWIGLPLGIAAIVLGFRARRGSTGSRMATVAIVLAGLAITQMAIFSAVSAVS